MNEPLILVLNCGSSSIKFALFDASARPLARKPAWQGQVSGITGAQPTCAAGDAPPAPLPLDSKRPYDAALAHIHALVMARAGGARRLAAVVHRVVHGGSKYFAPVRLDAGVLADLRSYIPLAPLHQPFALDAVDQLFRLLPELPQFACFDTAFHRTQEPVEQMLALPWSAWQRGMRRYGFHGLSYEYMSHVLPERHGDVARGRSIVCHLGNGASLCAMAGLRSVATTMGFSALDGLMMGTRCGTLDPGAVIYLMQIEKLSLEQVAHKLYHESGLLGVSGVSADLRELLPREAQDPQVRAALALYVRRIVREIGALTAVLGGLDLLVFTAGVGENNPVIRERVCASLAHLGVQLDAAANAEHAACISAGPSQVVVGVEPTNEEWIAAWHATRLLDAA